LRDRKPIKSASQRPVNGSATLLRGSFINLDRCGGILYSPAELLARMDWCR
jgi:hypothetical protein